MLKSLVNRTIDALVEKGMLVRCEGVDKRTAGRIETEIKYEGYIARQQRQIQEVKRQEATLIPADFDYAPLSGLRLEAREKLAAIRPANLAQAGRIPGVSPADLAVLAVALTAHRHGHKEEQHDQ